MRSVSVEEANEVLECIEFGGKLNYRTEKTGGCRLIFCDESLGSEATEFVVNLVNDNLIKPENIYGRIGRSLKSKQSYDVDLSEKVKDDKNLKKLYKFIEIKTPEPNNPFKTKVKWFCSDKGNYSYIDESNVGKLFETVYIYDANSAYSNAQLKDMPDTTVDVRLDDIVGEKEVGFDLDGNIINEGEYANFIFPLRESPYKKYVYYWYGKKANATDSEERTKCKKFLNYLTGLLQKHNIFHRLMILFYSKKYITQFIDENTLYCNVDSIISTEPRDDLPIGNNIGEFKLEVVHNFKYKGVGMYQYDTEDGKQIHYKGVSDDLLDDIDGSIDYNRCKYRFDEENRRIVKNETYQEE